MADALRINIFKIITAEVLTLILILIHPQILGRSNEGE
jgi:hypothetical protein